MVHSTIQFPSQDLIRFQISQTDTLTQSRLTPPRTSGLGGGRWVGKSACMVRRSQWHGGQVDSGSDPNDSGWPALESGEPSKNTPSHLKTRPQLSARLLPQLGPPPPQSPAGAPSPLSLKPDPAGDFSPSGFCIHSDRMPEPTQRSFTAPSSSLTAVAKSPLSSLLCNNNRNCH